MRNSIQCSAIATDVQPCSSYETVLSSMLERVKSVRKRMSHNVCLLMCSTVLVLCTILYGQGRCRWRGRIPAP